MFAKTKARKRRSKGRLTVQKARGVLHPRVEKVKPERFGIVSVDCAKARSKWMLTDFYGNVLVPPQQVSHTRGGFELAVALVRHTAKAKGLQDMLVAVERTGNYHEPAKRAFAAAGFETRIVHPFATKQFRQPADPGNKTDDTDLLAIFRATTSGFGLQELPWDEVSKKIQILARHRRDLVRKNSALCCQIREHLEIALPGYAALFETKLWDSNAALFLAGECGTSEQMNKLGAKGLEKLLRGAKRGFHFSTLEKIAAWARTATAPGAAAEIHRRVWTALNADRTAKTREIQALERELAALLAQTPYILLLTHCGVNVVSAAELAGEMGPITHYASAKAITGRAGIFPSRYQSDQVDLADGPLVRCANRSLRAALLMIADTLITCNPHFRGLDELWKAAGKDPRAARVKVACKFSRIAYQIVAGRQVFRHPAVRGRDYLLEKLMAFHCEHETPPAEMLRDLENARLQLPPTEYPAEAVPLKIELQKTLAARGRGPKPIGAILPILLAKLGVGTLQCDSSGKEDPG
jgi:transposase